MRRARLAHEAEQLSIRKRHPRIIQRGRLRFCMEG